MAFDQSTRGRLQKLVNSCRGQLSDEFSIQLQQTYGLDPKTGEVTPMARLTHLDDRQRHTAEVLRQTLAHYLGADADDTDHRISVLDRMVREQAFTVLNRLAALLMMESRGQLIESVSKGYQSRGYQLYSKIAGTALGETGQAYQVYLFSVFDELAQELPTLFDRYAANGLLFPRETALRALLEELNHFEIETLWGADETIGWIYQYFNSKEERKAMRDASQAPRNSRELAVRNQFFTPRYVVEFLVDNTLGRLWFNATGGQTNLRNSCQYLLVKHDEEPKTPVKLRDPRTLKLLDPACGSMHFGLYAFDVFVEIYREAWLWEQQNGPGSLDVSTQAQSGLKPLSQIYSDKKDFFRDIPRLIIENNIYGVDIDPRAAQIAGLSLWLRAQRIWYEAGIKPSNRPLIKHSNIVCAEPMPGEKELLSEFVEQHFPSNERPIFIFLLERIFESMALAGEAGSLLRMEEEIRVAIAQAYEIVQRQSQLKQVELWSDNSQPANKDWVFLGLDGQQFWEKAEQRIYDALKNYAETTQKSGGYQRRLFADDAAQGFAFIDLCRKRYDVVLMNPPFGLPTEELKLMLQSSYDGFWTDIYASFVKRASDFVNPVSGVIGAITSRTFIHSKQLTPMRELFTSSRTQLDTLLDLGMGVLDAAVETAAWFTCSSGSQSVAFYDWTKSNKDELASHAISLLNEPTQSCPVFFRNLNSFESLPFKVFGYWVPKSIFDAIKTFPTIEPHYGEVAVGMKTFDDFRFIRLPWEPNYESKVNGDFRYTSKGGGVVSLSH